MSDDRPAVHCCGGYHPAHMRDDAEAQEYADAYCEFPTGEPTHERNVLVAACRVLRSLWLRWCR